MDGGPPAKRTRRSPTGVEREAQTVRRCEEAISARQGEDLEKLKSRLSPVEEVTGSMCRTIRKWPVLFEANRNSKQSKVSQWGHLWVEQLIGNRGS